MKIIDAIAARPGPFFLVGSCKNAGKTTLLNHLNEQLTRRLETPPALATIGRDGEPEDIVWRHAKPPVVLYPGNLFVTTEPDLTRLKTAAALVEKMPFQTMLGGIVLGKALRETNVEIVGPDTNAQLHHAIERMARHGASHQLIDGAFERRTQIAGEQGACLALVVSADIGPDVEQAARWLSYQREMYDLPQAPPEFSPPPTFLPPRSGEEFFTPPEWPLGLHWLHGEKWNQDPAETETVFCKGPLTENMVDEHLDGLRNRDLVLEDATKLFLDRRHWGILQRRCRHVFVLRELRLLLVAANPCGLLRQFGPDEFFNALRQAAPQLPLIDVVAGLTHEP